MPRAAARPARSVGESVAVLALGGAHTPAFVHTATAWPLALAATGLLFWRLRSASPGRAAWLGWLYGTGWLCAGVWWLFVSMHRYGGLPAPLAALAVFALSGALSLYLAAACAAHARWRDGRPGRDALLFGALWLLAELARGTLFTGFPWLASGYALVDAPAAALAPWLGVFGLGAMAAGLVAWAVGSICSPLLSWPQRLARVLLAAGALLAGAVTGPGEHTQPAGRLEVSLVQTLIPQDEKFADERLPRTLEMLARQLREARGALVVAPETAVPLLPSQLEALAPGYWQALQSHFESTGRAALVGVPMGDIDSGYTNSVASLGAGAAYRYDKQHLVPFGEFVPPGFRWFTRMMDIPLGDFARGPLDAPSFAFRGQRVAPNICYEDLFGDELAARFVDPARAPTVMANVSNIGWFGNTVALPQHLNISRMRALELQRPMLRATNTGVTAIVDHRGAVTHRLPDHTRGVLEGSVEARTGTTPYAAWAGRFGSWPLALAALLVVVAAIATRRPGRGTPDRRQQGGTGSGAQGGAQGGT